MSHKIMVNMLNSSRNSKMIKIVNNCTFGFLESKENLESPTKNYYFKMYDLSINLRIKLKWSLYGYFFMKSISENIGSVEDFSGVNVFESSINNDFIISRKKHILTIDGIDVFDINAFLKETNEEYTKNIYEENSSVHFKLKVNIDEFIILQNSSIPELVFYQ